MKHLKIFEEFTPGIENIFHKFAYPGQPICGKGLIYDPNSEKCIPKLDFINDRIEDVIILLGGPLKRKPRPGWASEPGITHYCLAKRAAINDAAVREGDCEVAEHDAELGGIRAGAVRPQATELADGAVRVVILVMVVGPAVVARVVHRRETGLTHRGDRLWNQRGADTLMEDVAVFPSSDQPVWIWNPLRRPWNIGTQKRST